MAKFDLRWALETSKKIEGWLAPIEAELLYKLVSEIPQDTVIVEIGSYKGKSTVVLGAACKFFKKNESWMGVWAIDPHQKPNYEIKPQYDEWSLGTYKDSYEDFITNIKNAELEDIIISIRQTSEEAAKSNYLDSRTGTEIGLLFIDGLHQREYVQLDYDLWSPKVTRGGIIAFHDSNPSNRDFSEGAGIVADNELVKSGKYKWGRVKSITYGYKR